MVNIYIYTYIYICIVNIYMLIVLWCVYAILRTGPTVRYCVRYLAGACNQALASPAVAGKGRKSMIKQTHAHIRYGHFNKAYSKQYTIH